METHLLPESSLKLYLSDHYSYFFIMVSMYLALMQLHHCRQQRQGPPPPFSSPLWVYPKIELFYISWIFDNKEIIFHVRLFSLSQIRW